MSQTRFLLDGDRVQEDLTLFQNGVPNNAVIEVFSEMIGGKGPSDDAIREMLEDCQSDSDQENEADEMNISTEQHDVDQKWYENLKLQYETGQLKLSNTSVQDQKLWFLLKAKNLQPYEIIRLRNVYSIWEQMKIWREDTQELREIPKSKERPSDGSSGIKRTISIRPKDYAQEYEEVTPHKRKKVLETFGLTTPSPILKPSSITKIEMKRVSVSVHLWAERKMGQVFTQHKTE